MASQSRLFNPVNIEYNMYSHPYKYKTLNGSVKIRTRSPNV